MKKPSRAVSTTKLKKRKLISGLTMTRTMQKAKLRGSLVSVLAGGGGDGDPEAAKSTESPTESTEMDALTAELHRWAKDRVSLIWELSDRELHYLLQLKHEEEKIVAAIRIQRRVKNWRKATKDTQSQLDEQLSNYKMPTWMLKQEGFVPEEKPYTLPSWMQKTGHVFSSIKGNSEEMPSIANEQRILLAVHHLSMHQASVERRFTAKLDNIMARLNSIDPMYLRDGSATAPNGAANLPHL